MKVIHLEVNKKIVWECIASLLPVAGHTYAFERNENESKMRVKFTELGFENHNDANANMNCSWAKYLESLEPFCQKGIQKVLGLRDTGGSVFSFPNGSI